MNQLKINILANFAGRGLYALMSFAFVPFYIKFMGIEAYGLVGFFVTLQVLFSVLDFGLGATLNREMARYSVQSDKKSEARDLVRTLEVGYWVVGFFIGGIVLLLSPLIAYNWVKVEKLSPNTVRHAVMMMGLVIAFQWPSNLYAGGLRGLQLQVIFNMINTTLAALRGIGAILILWQLSATIQAFFLWQLLVSILQTLLFGTYLWRRLPGPSCKPRFRKELLSGIWHFAAGISATSLVIVILGQLDKVILSKILSLTLFGYYSIAATAASAVSLPMAPISEAIFPKLSQLIAQRIEVQIRQLYHHACQLTSVVLFPTASVLFFFLLKSFSYGLVTEPLLMRFIHLPVCLRLGLRSIML
jgi:O-antigen/teichoic acid export membrane protein